MSAIEHGQTVLAAIIPDRRDLLDRALRHLTPAHFADRVHANLFVMLQRYADVTDAILTRTALVDLLGQARADAGAVAQYTELYDLLHDQPADEPGFRWSLEQLRELAAERGTAAALTRGMEILTRGVPGERSELLRGHQEARAEVLQRFAEIDRELGMQDAPEGDMRREADEILADYTARAEARLRGHRLGVDFGIDPLDQVVNGLGPGELVLVAGYTSEGKAQPLDAPVLTPSGWRKMGDLRLGDAVVDPAGFPSTVIGIFPQGTQPVYRVSFSDGSTAEATADHLWQMRIWRPQRVNGAQVQRQIERTFTTTELARHVQSSSRRPFLVRTTALAGFDFPEAPLPIDPYLLGVLLGDGCLADGTPSISNPDPEIRAAVEDGLPEGMSLSDDVGPRCPTYRLVRGKGRPNPITGALRDLGLSAVHSWDKFVPEIYKTASAKTRLAILQGLMDTDGTHEKRRATFCSASQQLRDDVVWLARSLGLHAAVTKDKVPSYTYRGERRTGRVAYRCNIWEQPDLRVFRLPRKQGPLTGREGGRSVVAVEHVRDAECQCIKVSASSQLYVTSDFVPTHNTSLCVNLAWDAVVNQGKNVLVLTTETPRGQVRRRLVARHSCLPALGIDGGLNSREIRMGTLSAVQQHQMAETVKDFTNNPGYGHLYIAQIPRGASFGYCESKALNVQRTMFDIDLVIMDYLALLKPERRRNSDREELSNTLKEAKQFAVTFKDGHGVPFVSPWQVSRKARQDAEIKGYYSPDALSETAEASNSADQIITLLAPLDNDQRVVDLNAQVMKNRDGERANSVKLRIDYATSRFEAIGESRGGSGSAADSLFGGDPFTGL